MRLIDADALKDGLIDYQQKHTDSLGDDYWIVENVLLRIEEMPSLDAEPVRHGKWEVHEAFGYMDMTCSVCGWLYEYYAGLEEEWNYCSHCGAKMDEVNE